MSIITLERLKNGIRDSNRFTSTFINFAEGFIDLFSVEDGTYSYLLYNRFSIYDMKSRLYKQPDLLATVTAMWQHESIMIRKILRACELIASNHSIDVLHEFDPSKECYDSMSNITYYKGYSIYKKNGVWTTTYRCSLHPNETYTGWQSFGEKVPVQLPYDPLAEPERVYYATPWVPTAPGIAVPTYLEIPDDVTPDIWLAKEAMRHYYGVSDTLYGKTSCFLTEEQVTAILDLWVGSLSTDAILKAIDAKDPSLVNQILQLSAMTPSSPIHLPPIYVGHVHVTLPGISEPTPKYNSYVLSVNPENTPPFLDKLGTRYEAIFARDKEGGYIPAKVTRVLMAEVDTGNRKLKMIPSKK